MGVGSPRGGVGSGLGLLGSEGPVGGGAARILGCGARIGAGAVRRGVLLSGSGAVGASGVASAWWGARCARGFLFP